MKQSFTCTPYIEANRKFKILSSGPEQGIFCGVTSVRLSSSGNYLNTAVVSIRPADESDIAIATLVC